MIFLKALITGASGFVGKVMTQALLARNMEVLGISRSKSYLNGHESEDYKCDVLDKQKLKIIINSFKPYYLVHLAGPAFIPDSIDNPQRTYDIIFQGTFNVLDCIKELRLSTKILYVSSADVYGCKNKSVLVEADTFDPINPYSSAKACSELLCRQFFNTYGLNIVIARPFNHTGPGQSIDFVCSNFAYQIATMRSGENCSLFTGNIDVKRDFLDVKDVVRAYYKLLIGGQNGEAYNVCSGNATSIRQIIQMLFQYANIPQYEIIQDPNKTRINDVPIRVGDNSKIAELTGWKPEIKFADTVSEIFRYWKEHLNA